MDSQSVLLDLEHGRLLRRGGGAAEADVPGSRVEFAEDGLDLVTLGPDDVGIRAGLDGVQDVDALGDGLFEIRHPAEGDDAVTGDGIHLDQLDVHGGLRALTADECRLVGEGVAVEQCSREEVDRGRRVAEMGIGQEVLGVVRVELGQGQDEVVDDLVGGHGRNAVIPLGEGKGRGRDQGDDGGREQDAGETHVDGVGN